MNIYLFKKYWSKHKGRLFSLLLSIILLTATAVFSILNERAELRQGLHQRYNRDGNYVVVLHNFDDEGVRKIKDIVPDNEWGRVSAIGTITVTEDTYTVGCFEDNIAQQAYYLPIVEGSLPDKGQIAFPQFLLRQLYGDKEIGDEITIKMTDLNGQIHDMTFELSGIISDDITRDDMEYQGVLYGTQTIHNNEIYPSPSLYINKADTKGFDKYYNCIYAYDDEKMFHGNSESHKVLGELDDYKSRLSTGKLAFNLMSINNSSGTIDESGLTAKPSQNTRIIRYITFFMMLVAAISMFTGVMSIMPKRIESLQLLRSIGMSKRKLFGMFLTEFFLIWLIGNVIGIGTGCGVHELVQLARKLMGISSYRGYFAEFIVNQVTSSPFVMPIFMSFIVAVISLIIPIAKIITMSFYQKTSVKKSRRKAKNLCSSFSKITNNRFMNVLSALSVAIVISISMFGYCYYTNFGKGKTIMGIGNQNNAAEFYNVNGVNLKETGLDFGVSASTPLGNSIAVYDKEYGISIDNAYRFSETGISYAWGTYPTYTVIYEENDEKPLSVGNLEVELNPIWEHYDEFKDKTICNTQLIIVNENVLKKMGDYSADDIIAVSRSSPPYKKGNVVPMFSGLCDEGTHLLLETAKRIEVTITQEYIANESYAEEDEIIRCAICGFADNAIVMTGEKARQLGFYHADYNSCFVDLNSDMSDKEIRLMVNNIMGRPVSVKTYEELQHNAVMNTLSSNVNVIVLFILLFVLCLVSIINNIRMNIQNKIGRFSTLHVLGLSHKHIKKMFTSSIMLYTVFACVSGIIISYAGKQFMASRFEKYLELQEQLNAIPSYKRQDGSDYYILQDYIADFREKFFLWKEMWLPNLVIPLIIVCGIILLTTFLYTKYSVKQIDSERSLSNDQG